MTHATADELHDHVYGFRTSEHVPRCPECRRSADLLAAERRGLKEALQESRQPAPEELLARLKSTPPRPRRFNAPTLAAAAVLLGALTWMLFQPKAPLPSDVPLATTLEHDDDLKEILQQLKSASPLRQELARLALRKYGGIAVPALERAKADPDLIDECRGFTAEDRDFFRKAQSKRLTLDWQAVGLRIALQTLRELSGLNIVTKDDQAAAQITVTLRVQDASVVEILDRIKEGSEVPWSRSSGVREKAIRGAAAPYTPSIVVGAPPLPPPSLAPIRVRSIHPWAEEQLRKIGELKDDEKAFLLFSRLARAADLSLWNYLDAPRPEVRKLAENALRDLYAPLSQLPMLGREWNLVNSSTNLSFENKPTAEILLSFGQSQTTGGILLDPRVEIPARAATFKVKELSVRNALLLFLSQENLEYFAQNDWVLLTKPEFVPFRQQPGTSLWVSVEEGARAESVIEGLESDDPGRQGQARDLAVQNGRRALQWLAHASEVSQQRRLSDALLAVLNSLGIWYGNSPGGVRRQDLNPAQRAILERKLPLKSSDKPLAELLTLQGLQVRMKAPAAMPLLVSSAGFKVEDLLLGVTKPLGLDFYMDGDTIVVDTASNVHQATEK